MRPLLWAGLMLSVSLWGGCSTKPADESSLTSSGSDAEEKTILIDGSSTVLPITKAVAEEFMAAHPGIYVDVGNSGTTGGFGKFIKEETVINDASRPIKPSEVEALQKAGIDYLELKIAIDGLSVVVHPENDWCDRLTTEELKRLWAQGSPITKWSQLRDGFPDEDIILFGPGEESGTFDYFVEVILGKNAIPRQDYGKSANDNDLVREVSRNKGGLGYFGYAYYQENRDKLKALAIAVGDDLSAAVAPTPQSVADGTYRPLSRPLFLYVNRAYLQEPHVADFLKFYIEQGPEIVARVGYVALDQPTYAETQKKLQTALAGEGGP